MARVLVIGASLAGYSVAEALREQGNTDDVVLVGDELIPPYDRPPLSKQMLDGRFSSEDCLLRPEGWYSENQVHLRTGVRAVHLDAARRVVTFADGSSQEADHVVVATGARARRLPGWGSAGRVRYLRTVEDGARLRSELAGVPGRLCVVGAGFIGLEVASAAATAGWAVTVLEAAGSPMSRVLPPEAAQLCVQPVLDLGVVLRLGETAAAPVLDPSGATVLRLSGGDAVTADLIVVGAGALPNVEWLTDSGLDIDNGVVCRSSGRTSAAGVWAVGDVARWPNAVTGHTDRVEHWQAAREQAQVVARGIDGTAGAWSSPPYFWSDLGGAKVQFVGASRPEWRTHVVHDGRRTLCLIGDERLRGILTVAQPRKLALGRRLLLAKASFEDGLRWAAA